MNYFQIVSITILNLFKLFRKIAFVTVDADSYIFKCIWNFYIHKKWNNHHYCTKCQYQCQCQHVNIDVDIDIKILFKINNKIDNNIYVTINASIYTYASDTKRFCPLLCCKNWSLLLPLWILFISKSISELRTKLRRKSKSKLIKCTW